MLGVVPGVLILLDGFETHAILQLNWLKERVLSAEEVVQSHEGIGVGLIQDDDLTGVQLVSFYDAEDSLVSVYTFCREFLVLEELLSFVIEADVLFVGLLIVLREHEAVDDVLRPAGADVINVHLAALFLQQGNHCVEFGLGGSGLLDFFSLAALIDDDLTVGKELGQDVDVSVRTKGDLACVAVAEQDFGFVRLLVPDARECECD